MELVAPEREFRIRTRARLKRPVGQEAPLCASGERRGRYQGQTLAQITSWRLKTNGRRLTASAASGIAIAAAQPSDSIGLSG